MTLAITGLGEKETSWRQIMMAVWILTLATVGNAILPIPYAFAITGAVASTLIITCVALSNVFTCRLLLRGATATGASDYGHLAYAVGGSWMRLWTELWIVLLLVGTNIGAIIQMGEAFGYAIESQWPHSPTWIWGRSGTTSMVFFTLGIIFPLCMLPKIKKLELVGAFGSIILWVLAGIVLVKAVVDGMPALTTADFPHVSSRNLTNISKTFSLLCFAFYHQVMMMPLLSEMPRVCSETARRNADDLNHASTITILLTSGLTYWVVGFFGASMYGATNISDNLLQNKWLPGIGTFFLNLSLTIYLSISIPPIFHATNHTVEAWLRSLFPRAYGSISRPWLQRFTVNCCTILPCLAMALAVPGESGTVLSITGATGVAMCSYLLPVVFHFALHFGKARCTRVAGLPPCVRNNEELGEKPAGSGLPAALEVLLVEQQQEEPEAPLLLPLNMCSPAPDARVAASSGGLTAGPSSEASEDRTNPLSGSSGSTTRYRRIAADDVAPAGLVFHYREAGHPLVLLCCDVVLPILVAALGCFFSVATLVLLLRPAGKE